MTELQFKVSSLIPTLLLRPTPLLRVWSAAEGTRVREERVMNYEKINSLPLQKIEEQRADVLRLFLLHPMSRAIGQIAAEHGPEMFYESQRLPYLG